MSNQIKVNKLLDMGSPKTPRFIKKNEKVIS